MHTVPYTDFQLKLGSSLHFCCLCVGVCVCFFLLLVPIVDAETFTPGSSSAARAPVFVRGRKGSL